MNTLSKWAIIGTWAMALEGITEGSKVLQEGLTSGQAIEDSIKLVENNPFYKSVGYGGLPNERCEVELDAAFMHGDTLSVGAIAGIKDFSNPISIAKKLSEDRFNIFLVGDGAEKYAHKNGFERKNMLTEESKEAWEERVKQVYEKNLSAYDGHDTVGMVSLDKLGTMCAGTSTSGLFMKRPGRVGDSPIVGSGLYVNSSIGGASATGLGEDIMKGCLSYEIVRLMEDGMLPQEAADKALFSLDKRLKKRRGIAGAMSVVCLNNEGQWGVSTNIEFPFVVATNDMEPKILVARPNNGKTETTEATKEWLANHKE